MKIRKDIPIPDSYGEFRPLLKMEIGDCVEFTTNYKLRAASQYLSKRFKVRTKTIQKSCFGSDEYLGRLWRIK